MTWRVVSQVRSSSYPERIFRLARVSSSPPAVPERHGHVQGGERDHVRVSLVGLRVARQQLGGLAHRASGQIGHGETHVAGDRQWQRADGVGLVHHYQHPAALREAGQQIADLFLVLPQRPVVDPPSIGIEGARVVRLLADVQSEPHIDVVGLYGGLLCAACLTGRRDRIAIMTPGPGSHITIRPRRIPKDSRGGPCPDQRSPSVPPVAAAPPGS